MLKPRTTTVTVIGFFFGVFPLLFFGGFVVAVFLPFWFSLSQMLNGIMGRENPVGTPVRALLSHDKVTAFSYRTEEATPDLDDEVCIFGNCFGMMYLLPGF